MTQDDLRISLENALRLIDAVQAGDEALQAELDRLFPPPAEQRKAS